MGHFAAGDGTMTQWLVHILGENNACQKMVPREVHISTARGSAVPDVDLDDMPGDGSRVVNISAARGTLYLMLILTLCQETVPRVVHISAARGAL